MGVKSYVAGLKSDAAGGAIDTAMSVLGGVSTLAKYNEALDQAKDKSDINRETTGIRGLNDEFLNDLKYDREYDTYQEKVDAHFDELASMIDDNALLSDKAKHTIKNEYLPDYKNQVTSKAGVIMVNGKMAEIEVEVEGFGNALASDENLSRDKALEGYRTHLDNLGIFNEATIGKMVEDYSYSTSPIKAMQLVQREYENNQANDEFNFTASMNSAAAELDLDAFQKKEMKKQLATWKSNFDKQQDELFSLQLEEINAGIAQAYDEGEIFVVDILDEAMKAMPARHRLSVYKAKNTAHTNNDKLIEQSAREISDRYDKPSKEIWDLVKTIHDPFKQDEIESSLLVSYGESLLAEEKSLSEALGALERYDEAPVTPKVRNKASAALTKAYLDREGDVTKVAKEMLANTGGQIDTIARIPQDTLTDAVETAKPEAPAIDTSQLEERGVEYIEEHISEVAEVIAPKISIGLGLPGISVDVSSDRGASSSPEAVREVAKMIVEDQVDAIIHEGGEKPLEGQETEPDPESEPTWEEPWWYSKYLENRAASRKEIEEEQAAFEAGLAEQEEYKAEQQARIDEERAKYQAKIDAQAKSVREEAGIVDAPEESGEYSRPPLEPGMPQDKLIANMLQIIHDGKGEYIEPKELSLIKNDDIRDQMKEMASIKDYFLVDSPLALSFIDSLRRDENVSQEFLRRTVAEFVNGGYIKAETAESGNLTNKYSFANNPNKAKLTKYLEELALEVFPAKEGEVYTSNRSRLNTVLTKVADNAIAMNPDLLGKDFPKLQEQLQSFATEELAKKALNDLEDVTTYLSSGDATSQIRNLKNSSVSTFMQDVQEGQYDALLDYDMLQQPDVRLLRNKERDIVQDALTKKMTAYRDYAQLTSEGTLFDQVRVMANASFLLAGGVLENSLRGSFGIEADDMKLMGKNWAFADPVADGLYFIATDTDATKRGTLGWGMATADSDGVHNLAMFKDYVDPQLAYEIEDLEFTINDPLFKKRHEEYLNPTPKGGGLYKDVPEDASWRKIYGPKPVEGERGGRSAKGGLWANAPKGASLPETYKEDPYQKKIDLYEQKKQELEQLTADIIQYRYSLMGLPNTALRKKL